MCFNDQVSMGAFLVGIYFSLIFFQRQLFIPCIILIIISFIQLIEYYGHIGLKRNNKNIVKGASIAIMVLLFLQPVIVKITTYFLNGDKKNIVYFLVLFIIMGILLYKYIISNKDKEDFQLKYLDNRCSNICRLKWSMLQPKLFPILFLIFYFYIITFGHNYDDMTGQFFAVLLVLSLIYITVIDKIVNIKGIYSAFGGMWCLSSILYGPLYFLLNK